MCGNGRVQGFTLIELMLVVVILGIIAAIAYPTFMEQVRKSRRADARVTLMEISQRQEREFTETNSYTGDLTDLGYTSSPSTSPKGWYVISVTSLPAGDLTQSFTLTATTAGAQTDDSQCTTLTLDSRGTKGATGGGTTCW